MSGRVSDLERSRRWRMVLGGIDDGESAAPGLTSLQLDGHDARIDAALAALYDAPRGRRSGGSRAGGLGSSAPAVARWLGDIRRYFPTSVVQVLQRDAIDRLKLRQLLLEPEMLRAVEPDLHLVTLLVELNRLLPDSTRTTARQVVQQVVGEIERGFPRARSTRYEARLLVHSELVARDRATSTGVAPFMQTCGTICPSSRP